MELYLPGYEQDIEKGAGLTPSPGKRKVIIHTTETGPGTLNAVRNSWRGSQNWGKGLPHFISEGRRFVQCLPLNVGGYTSKNGGIDANRCGCPIQIEIVHYARDPFNDTEYDALGRWLADLVRAGIGLDLNRCPEFYGEGDGYILASVDSPVRDIINNEFGGYPNFNSFCGHQHLEGNDHWDPGDLDEQRVCKIALDYLNPSPEDAQEDDDMLILMTTKPGSIWARDVLGNPNGGVFVANEFFIKACSPDDVAHYQKIIANQKATGAKPTVGDWGPTDDAWFWIHTLIPREKMGF